ASLTGSPPMMNAIGIVEVSALASSAADSPPVVTRTLTGLRTRSEASPASRSRSPSPQRYSIVAFWPSTKPASRRPRRNASTRCQVSSGDLALRYPITGVGGCCARAASGHTAAPATRVMNSRRLIVAPRDQSHALHRVTAVRGLKRAERDVNCDQLYWAGNVGFGSHDRLKTGKTQNRLPVGEAPRAAAWATRPNLMTQHAQIAEHKYSRPHARPFRLRFARVVAVLPVCSPATL